MDYITVYTVTNFNDWYRLLSRSSIGLHPLDTPGDSKGNVGKVGNRVQGKKSLISVETSLISARNKQQNKQKRIIFKIYFILYLISV